MKQGVLIPGPEKSKVTGVGEREKPQIGGLAKMMLYLKKKQKKKKKKKKKKRAT